MKNQKQIRFGDVLRKWRLMSQLEQRGAAKQMGISASTLCRLERGEVRPDAETFIRLIQWLLGDVE